LSLIYLPQWQRLHDWQAGLRRSDPTTEGEIYAVRRGLQIATKMLPANAPDNTAADYRTKLVEEIHTRSQVNGKSPTDSEIIDMFGRHVTPIAFVPGMLEASPYHRVVGKNVNPPLGIQLGVAIRTRWTPLYSKESLQIIGASAGRA